MELRLIVLTIVVLLIVNVLLQQTRKPYELPKIVWTHWDSEHPPETVMKTIDRMRKMMPDWQVNFITTERYLSSINQEEIPPNFNTLRVEHQADWIRLKLLKDYGGCWIDSGIILNQSINNLYRDCVSSKADLLVFKILGTQTNPRYPIAENWLIMAPPHSPIITVWLEEYERAIQIGFKRYKDKMKEEGVDLQNLMKKREDVYLTQHGCFQKVIQQRMPPGATIVYHTAEDTMFKIHARICKWDKPCIWKTLKDVEYCRTIPYIKLRGGDRKNVDILPLLV
jgi:mannosyltransferase OCH1-like enzyme